MEPSTLQLAGRRRSLLIFTPYLSAAVSLPGSSEDLKLNRATHASGSDGLCITCSNDIDCVFVYENQVNVEQPEQPAHVQGLLDDNYEDHQGLSKRYSIRVHEGVSCFAESAKLFFSDEHRTASCLTAFSSDFVSIAASFSSAVHSPEILAAAPGDSAPGLWHRSLPVAASATNLPMRSSRGQGSTGLIGDNGELRQSQTAEESSSTADEVTSPVRFRMRRIQRVVRDLNCLG
ncbi:hypothetical protein VaNZ11_002661 [Volvox africanus]|uniref:Uncharacterized protein n=1 Tax=Volvox africanus TaxID=51714 RepID=A0ABQ5RTF0_9CHLO|nr:hypothetical protein VaNZ11_002661 [Volvox africanus]